MQGEVEPMEELRDSRPWRPCSCARAAAGAPSTGARGGAGGKGRHGQGEGGSSPSPWIAGETLGSSTNEVAGRPWRHPAAGRHESAGNGGAAALREEGAGAPCTAKRGRKGAELPALGKKAWAPSMGEGAARPDAAVRKKETEKKEGGG